VFPLLQLGHIDADQSRLHRELFLRETAVDSKSLELLAETLNGAQEAPPVRKQETTR
jgi:hypothetical protein